MLPWDVVTEYAKKGVICYTAVHSPCPAREPEDEAPEKLPAGAPVHELAYAARQAAITTTTPPVPFFQVLDSNDVAIARHRNRSAQLQAAGFTMSPPLPLLLAAVQTTGTTE